ncbi:MAG: hypothetical protein LBD88_01945 [Candidatus Peribacteria bacterium]|nr:hypothetical protein [Candidatus Peribacteria bacterium]
MFLLESIYSFTLISILLASTSLKLSSNHFNASLSFAFSPASDQFSAFVKALLIALANTSLFVSFSAPFRAAFIASCFFRSPLQSLGINGSTAPLP